MRKITILLCGTPDNKLINMMKAVENSVDCCEYIHSDECNCSELKGKRLIFALQSDEYGFCCEADALVKSINNCGPGSLDSNIAGLLVSSSGDLYTKSLASQLAFRINLEGCALVSHSLVEAISEYRNYNTWQKTLNMQTKDICREMSFQLGRRLADYKDYKYEKKKNIVVIHASSRNTSNTLLLWEMIKEILVDFDIEELNVNKGIVMDCRGCSYTECLHYGKQKSCYYGGSMVGEIYPAVIAADAVIWLCPNYNDSISANLMAVINRLTAIYRTISFCEKKVFSVIVSGNSGSDSVARQLIDSLNFNKGFYLPPYFSIMELANDPGSIEKNEGIKERAIRFAERIQNAFEQK